MTRGKKKTPVQSPPKPARVRLPNLTPRRFRRVCLILTIAAFGLRMAGLSVKSVNIDEISTRQISRNLKVTGLVSEYGKALVDWIWGREQQPGRNPNRNIRVIGTRPPLSFVAISPFLDLHDSQVMLLLPAVLFGAATVGLLGWAGRVGFGCRVGLVAALLILFSPLHIEYSQYARYYPFMVFFSLASFFHLDLWLRMRRWRYLGFWFLCATLNMLSHFFAAFVVGLQIAVVLGALWWFLMRSIVRGTRAWTAVLTSAAFAVVAGAAWVGLTRTGLYDMIVNQITDRPEWETQGIDYGWAFWRPYLVEMSGWPERLLPIALLLLAVGLVMAWKRNKLFLAHLLFLLIVPVYVVCFLQPGHAFDIQYVSFALPFHLLAIAAGIVAFGEPAVQNRRVPARLRAPLGLVSGCLVLAVPLIGFNTFADQPVRREFRDLVRYLEHVVRPRDTITFTLRDDEVEFRYFVSERKRQERRRLGTEGATTETISAGLPFRGVGFRRHESWEWETLKRLYYPKRLVQPFWHIAGRLHGHYDSELEWALNSMGHQAFETAFAFFGMKQTELRIDRSALKVAGLPPPLATPPEIEDERQSYRLSVFVPRSGEYYILSDRIIRNGFVRIEGLRPPKWITLAPNPQPSRSKTWIPEGRHTLTLLLPLDEDPVGECRMRILPAVTREYSINASQFEYITPYKKFDMPICYRGHFGFQRRLWGEIFFPVVLEKTSFYEFSVTANNDRPTANQIGIRVNKKIVGPVTYDRFESVARLIFDSTDNTLETKTAKIGIRAGIYRLGIQNQWYPEVDIARNGPVEDLRKTTFVSRFSIRSITKAEYQKE